MKKSKKTLLNEFNNVNSLLMISLYPNKGEVYSVGKSGVASYAKNLATHMNRKVVALVDRQNDRTSYREKNTYVIPCFKKNSPLLWITLLSQIMKFTYIKNVLIQFDFSIYGGIISTGFLIPFLILLKLFHYNVYVINHHVVSDANKLSGHLGLTTNYSGHLKAFLYNISFHLFYLLLGISSKKIIVLENSLEEKLNKMINKNKVITIPHAVDTSLFGKNKVIARKKLHISTHEFVVLFFGYINWFKGADIFATTFSKITSLAGKKTRFILAGGKSPTLRNKQYYEMYYQNVQSIINSSKNIQITGYIPQNQIVDYFSAADLIVFPYREFMCASGVLSLVFSYEKPFILSKQMTSMISSPDFSKAMELNSIKKKDLAFNLEQKDFISVTKKVLHNGLKKKIKNISKILKHSRSFTNNARLYEKLMFATDQSESSQLPNKYKL